MDHYKTLPRSFHLLKAKHLHSAFIEKNFIFKKKNLSLTVSVSDAIGELLK